MQSVYMSSTMSPSIRIDEKSILNQLLFMTREEKNKAIDELSAQLVENKNFYLTDIAGLNAAS